MQINGVAKKKNNNKKPSNPIISSAKRVPGDIRL